MLKTIGTILLAVGFLLLAAAVVIRDPTSLDADIGAGILSLAGLPAGALGLVLVIVDALLAVTRRRRPVRT